MRIDRTLELVRQGYPWARRFRGTADAAPTRLLGREAVVVGGPAGVRRFYDPRLRRQGSLPAPIKLLLFGPGTVHGLDDAEHHHRKAMYLDLLTEDAVAALGERAEREWERVVRHWAERDHVVLFDEAVRVLAASVFPWAGVPVAPEDLPRRARQLTAVLDGFAVPGPAYARAVLARLRLGRWARRLVRGTRAGRIRPEPGTALHAAATARDHDGRLLPERVAATAVLNVVRPTVAVAWFVAFAGRALHEHPEWRHRIAEGDEAALAAFAQEVRRFYPFVPVLPARARERQDVLGVPVPRGGLVVLDVYGTLHDATRWPSPDRFDPSRFLTGDVDPDALVPQGGGEVRTGHRCPGESVTLTMITVAVRALARLPFTVPPQDLGFDLSRVLTRPRSGVVLRLRHARS
ncbi:fatty-acid peroxygenase [Streptoalloteichus tenebrarius]|uniref:Fatty-acid peroxygenase n=1 Tax=Streptoalloteichus tenebrarius (strain ATCC 17920 / DSM 40477 / JCM 4838 / CBS 697.72 / NBRC 16177 / NCIMB 11028 / NRRL B-12390 / A12253. 1 / ISP 5477) TaxID=1933 RepID=A0ABT1HRI5_STRSD|nr:cytochrome P450 [Streptoalloteichus tenebrarius]MCP2258134.1 fatty-acid peroxygenase [Streptoalloteichus tenebrarius]